MPCKVVYELHAEFNSLLDMQEKKEKEKPKDGNESAQADENPEDDDGEEGVLLKSFLESSTLLKEKHPEIGEKILIALGISIHAKKARIKWSNYLKLNSLLKYATARQEEFLGFWLKVTNPN